MKHPERHTPHTDKPKRPKKPQQLQISGTERKQIRAIEIAADNYREARDERMELTESEVAARDALVQEMRKADVKVYKFHDHDGEEITVELDETTKVKVRKKGARPESEDA